MIPSFRIARWSLWTPEICEAEQWRTWAAEPRALRGSGVPDLPFLPPLQRRRCDALARMMLHVANECCTTDERATFPVVFASRFGPIDTTVALLEAIARGETVSPTRFSHSVHNTQLGLFSIWSGNRAPASSIAAGAETFAAGFLEAAALMQRLDAEHVLYVVGDTCIPEPLDSLGVEVETSHALALLLAQPQTGPRIGMRRTTNASSQPWPDALSFVQWLLGDQAELRLGNGESAWCWIRDST